MTWSYFLVRSAHFVRRRAFFLCFFFKLVLHGNCFRPKSKLAFKYFRLIIARFRSLATNLASQTRRLLP